MNVSPLHQFRQLVAERLQKPPYNWVGECGFELQQKYADLVSDSWDGGMTVDVVADRVHHAHMSRKLDYSLRISKSALQAAGCKFYRA
jgi:hypothetical protein